MPPALFGRARDPGRTFGALRDARLGPGSSGTHHHPRRMAPTRTAGSLPHSGTGLPTAVEEGPAFGRAKNSELQSAFVGEGKKPIIGDNHMVEYLYSH